MSTPLTAAAGTPPLQITAGGALSISGDSVGPAYGLPVFIHNTTTTSDNVCVWAMLNPVGATLSARITDLDLVAAYAGLAATGDTVLKGYSIEKFTTAVPAGGTELTVQKYDTDNATSTINNARFAAGGVTMTNAVYSGPLANVMTPVTATASVTPLPMKRGGHEIVLAPGEGLAILLEGAAAAGLHIVGSIGWVEI